MAQTGSLPPELVAPPLPACVAPLWLAFVELNAARPGGFGPSPLGHEALVAWQRLARVRLTPWEAETLLAMDRAALAAAAQK